MKPIFDLLDSFGLGPADTIPARLSQWGDEEFQNFFEAHASVDLEFPPPAERTATDIVPDTTASPLELDTIKQLAVYVNRFDLPDPLAELRDGYDQLTWHLGAIAKQPKREDRLASFREKAAASLQRLVELRPLVDANVIQVLPAEATPRKDPRALPPSSFIGKDGRIYGDTPVPLPPQIAEYAERHLQGYSVRFNREDGDWYPVEGGKPSRVVAVHFDDGESVCRWALSEGLTNPKGTDFSAAINIGESTIDEQTYANWLQGRRHCYVTDRLSDLHVKLTAATLVGAHFLTPIRSSADLIMLSLGDDLAPPNTVSALLRCRLPYMDDITMADIAAARCDEVAFEEFRLALGKAFAQFQDLGEGDFQKQVDDVCRDLIDGPLRRIDAKMKAIRGRFVKDIATFPLGTLIATILPSATAAVATAATTGSTLLTTAAAAAGGAGGLLQAGMKVVENVRKKNDQQADLRLMPSFFYWEATRKARGKK